MLALRRFPIRARLTLAFAAAMALVLTATGGFVYVRMGSELDRSVNQGLQSRVADVLGLTREADPGGSAANSALTERGESFAQVITARNALFDATPELRSGSLLGPAEVRRALRHRIFLDRSNAPGIDGRARLLAEPVRAHGRRLVVLVGGSLDDRDTALSRLLLTLAIGGPVALALASLAGYGVAAAALRPVESMRREAAEVSLKEPGRRLPVPTARDELQRLADTLNEMLSREEASFARERAFVSDASHELRTPLSILRTELELALRRGRSVEELESALRSAAEETDRLTQLAEDLLVLARSDQGRLPVRLEELSATPLLERARDRHARRAAEAGRAIRLGSDGELRLVADRLRVEQALGNLVENALRHGQGEVVLSAVPEVDAVELHVSDRGPGFPDPFLPSAFERFTRADPGRTGGGAGLGLAIVAAIASAHGGGAAARNRPEGGADVWLRLPIARPFSSTAHPPLEA